MARSENVLAELVQILGLCYFVAGWCHRGLPNFDLWDRLSWSLQEVDSDELIVYLVVASIRFRLLGFLTMNQSQNRVRFERVDLLVNLGEFATLIN